MSFRRILLLAVVVSTLVVPLLSCAEATPSVAILNILTPDQMCVAGVSNPPIFDGRFDVQGVDTIPEYRIFPLLGNRMVTTMIGPGPLRTESNDFTLQGAVVTLADVDDNVVAGPFLVDANGFAPAGTTTIAGRGVGGITIVPVTVLATLQARVPTDSFLEIHAQIQAFGMTSGGSHIELDDYVFPFTVCNGCLRCTATLPAVPCRPGSDNEPYGPPTGC